MKGECFMSKRLVAYFSASGRTAGVAEKLAEAAGADLYEIKPQTPYTKEDLNWTNRDSRSNVEMNDPASRPAIEDVDAKVEGYDMIFLGFPIWWYTAPTIVNTFLENYDWAGKTIILFATSGSSGLEETSQSLAGSCPGAILQEGRMMNDDPSVEALKEWVESLAI